MSNSSAARITSTRETVEIQPADLGDIQVSFAPTAEEIAIRAYEIWERRGGPLYSNSEDAQQDWFRAEQELIAEMNK